MAEAEDFTQKAEEAEALAASTENPLLRMTLRILAQDYRVLAEQENEPPLSSINLSNSKIRRSLL